MSYQTTYTLEVNNLSNEKFDTYIEILDTPEAVVEKVLDKKYIFNGEGSWRGFDSDMKTVSAFFPNVLFTLTGAGEEADDLWRAYFLDGKMQHVHAEIFYPGFDADKLV